MSIIKFISNSLQNKFRSTIYSLIIRKSYGGMKGDIKELKDSKGIPGVLAAAAALTALAAFARGTMFEDLIRLPGQLKGIKGMATFATGVSKIGTLGLGAKFIDNATDSLKLFKSNNFSN